MPMRITRETTRKLLIELSIEYDVRLHFNRNKNKLDGSSRYWNRSISISLNQSCTGMISTFFHEVGHQYCWDNNIWKSYHINKPIENEYGRGSLHYEYSVKKSEKYSEYYHLVAEPKKLIV